MDMRKRIQIDFPIPVRIHCDLHMELIRLVREICKRNCPEGREMWPCGFGSLPTYIPLTQEEEDQRGMEFDDSVYHIEICIK